MKLNLREESLGAGRTWWNQECRWRGTDTRQLWDRALTQQRRKRSCWQILRERQKAVAGHGMEEQLVMRWYQ